jgi:hypothetical protein
MQIIIPAFVIVALLFIAVLLSTVIGGVVGWIVEAVFPFVIVTLNQIAGTELTGFETGAVLGFFGSFFRSSSSSK